MTSLPLEDGKSQPMMSSCSRLTSSTVSVVPSQTTWSSRRRASVTSVEWLAEVENDCTTYAMTLSSSVLSK